MITAKQFFDYKEELTHATNIALSKVKMEDWGEVLFIFEGSRYKAIYVRKSVFHVYVRVVCYDVEYKELFNQKIIEMLIVNESEDKEKMV